MARRAGAASLRDTLPSDVVLCAYRTTSEGRVSQSDIWRRIYRGPRREAKAKIYKA